MKKADSHKFCLVEVIAGRRGRGGKPPTVILLTAPPEVNLVTLLMLISKGDCRGSGTIIDHHTPLCGQLVRMVRAINARHARARLRARERRERWIRSLKTIQREEYLLAEAERIIKKAGGTNE